MNLFVAFIVFIFLCKLNHIVLSDFKLQNHGSILFNIYFLTIGLVIDPLINAAIIFLYFLYILLAGAYINKRIINLFLFIIFTILYIIFNTVYHYYDKVIDPVFNPYVGMIEYIVYFLYFILISITKMTENNKNKLIEIISLFSIGVFASVIIGWLTSGFSLEHRITGIFVNPNPLGVYSAIILAFNVFRHTQYIKPFYKNMIILLSGIMLILSTSRVAWLGFIVFFVFYLAHSDIKKAIKISILGIFSFILILLIFKDQILFIFHNRILTAFNFKDASTSDRLVLAKIAIMAIKKHLLLGMGIRSYPNYMFSSGFHLNSSAVFHPHNAYLELLQSLGFIGFCLFFLIIIYIIKLQKSINLRHKTMIKMFLAFGIFSRVLNEFPITIFWWTLLYLL